ncbi:MAG: methyl-accepting chemotaxis protein [gamma proteobacterium symbiont of Taylorina sp.]|nr:methyl-accepting chemotaxis protein [gamma proteobacterium symbiont of Taylorina sp.]
MLLINKLSIKGRIMVLSTSLILIILFVSIYSLFSLRNVGGELKGLVEQDIPITNALTRITIHQLEQAIHFERALHFGSNMANENDKEASSKNHFNEQVDAFRILDKKVATEFTEIEAMAKVAIEHSKQERERKEFEHILHQLEKIEKEHKSYSNHSEDLFEQFKQGHKHQAEIMAEKIEKAEDQLDHELEVLLEEIEKFTELAAKQVEEHEQNSEMTLLIIAIFSVLFGSGLAWTVSNSTQQRLNEVAYSLNLIAGGDFSEEINQQDEIAIPMRDMRDKLVEMITQINTSTNILTTTATNLSAITVQTNSNIQQQQQETEQASSAMAEMRTAVQDVTSNIQSVSNMASQSNEQADNGASIVDNTVQDITLLTEKINEATSVIADVEKDSTNINSVLEVIKGIAEQTNLLALNAAIEAARAGEQGRGFAVVADEVRTLAVRTQESTTEINQIIEKLHSATQKAVNVMSESQDQAKNVVEKAALAGSSLGAIVSSVSEIANNSEQIASAAHQQNAVTENMSANIEHISDMAIQNLEGADQINEASDELVRITSELKKCVSQFKL